VFERQTNWTKIKQHNILFFIKRIEFSIQIFERHLVKFIEQVELTKPLNVRWRQEID
jgi:hypothetical protein